MNSPPKLDYSNPQTRSPSGIVSATVSLCLGCLVSAEAIYAGSIMRELDQHADTEHWAMLGLMLSLGAVVAAIGFACALRGWIVQSSPNRLRQIGGALNGAYLLGYLVLLAVLVRSA